MKIIRIEFCGKTITIQNQTKANPRRNFDLIWNGYTLEGGYEKISKDSHNNYWISVWSPMGGMVCDSIIGRTMSECIQTAFNNIQVDVENMISARDEYNQWLELFKEFDF